MRRRTIGILAEIIQNGPDSHGPDRSVAADILLRQEPDEEEGDGKEDDDDGYSE